MENTTENQAKQNIAKLSVWAFALAAGILWALALGFVGVLNRIDSQYGVLFLHIVDSVYPIYDAAYGLKNLAVGVAIAFVDGAIAGALLAWIYNMILCCCKKRHGCKAE